MSGEIESRLIEVDGIKYTVELVNDDDARPQDYDCYGSVAISEFKRGAWQFVGVVVTPTVAGDAAALRDEETQETSGFAVALELRRIADIVQDGIRPGDVQPLRDANGNTVGEWRVTKS